MRKFIAPTLVWTILCLNCACAWDALAPGTQVDIERMRSKPTKIIHVSAQDPHHTTGGQGVVILNLCKEQIKMGYDVTWISLRIKDEASEESFLDNRLSVRRIDVSDSDEISTPYAGNEQTQYNRRIEFGDAFVSFIKENYKPEEVYIHLHGFYEEPRRAGELISTGYNATSTYHLLLSPRLEQTQENEPFLSRIKELERESFMANEKIILNAPGMIDELRGLCPNYPGEISVIPNGADDECFELPPSPRDTVPLVSTYGRIAPEKGFELFIEASKIVGRKKKAEFLLFGRSDDTERARRDYHATLKKLAGVGGNIKFDIRNEGIWGKEKIGYVDRSAIGVIPSLYEPFGIVILEYMARGVPIVTTLTSGSRYILGVDSLGKTPYGWIVDKTPKSLAEAISWLLDNPEEAQIMGRNAKKLAENYRWSKIAKQTMAVYSRGGVEYMRERAEGMSL